MMKKIMIIMAAAAALTSCSSELPEVDGGKITKDGLVSIDFGVTIPARPTVDTRAIGETGTINNLTLAVFDHSGMLIETAEAKPVNGGTVGNVGDNFSPDNDGSYHFNVLLHATDGETHVHFIAGTHEPITPGSENNIMGNLLTKATDDGAGNWTFPEAYWRRVVIPEGISAGTHFNNVALIRNSLKISLQVSTEAQKRFTMTGYELVRVPVSTHTALYHDGEFLDDYQKDTDHGYDWVKGQYNGGGWSNPGYLETIISDQSADAGKPNVVIDANAYKSPAPKYMYQRSIVSNQSTYLIVKGKYHATEGDTGEDCYYKINLADVDDHLMPLYRNFHYVFTIESIEQGVKGETTPYMASQSSGSGGITIGVITHYETENTPDGNLLKLGWTENTFNHDDYANMTGGYVLLPATYTVENTTSNDRIYLEDEHGNVFYAGANSGKSVPAGKRNGDVTEYNDPLVFSKAEITGQNIQLYLNEPIGTRKQIFYVCVGDFRKMVTVHSIAEIRLGITCDPQVIETGLNKDMTVTVQMPQGLPSSLFPMNLYLYVKNNSLSPVAGSDLVVGTGTAPGATTGTYYFTKTLSWEDYNSNDTGGACPIVNGKVTVPLSFKTSEENSGSVVGVTTDKATAAWTEFTNTPENGTFSDVKFTDFESTKPQAGAKLTLSFQTSSITTADIVLAPGLEPDGEYMSELTDFDLTGYPQGSKAYTMYSVTSGTHTVALKTTAAYQTSQTLQAFVASNSTGYSSQAIGERTARLHVVDVDVDVDVAFTQANFSNATPSQFTGTGSDKLKVSLSTGRPKINYFAMASKANYNWSGTTYTAEGTITLNASPLIISKVDFIMSQNEMGVKSSVGTMSTTASGTISPSWTGTASTVTFEGTTAGKGSGIFAKWSTNYFTSMKVHIMGAHYEIPQ